MEEMGRVISGILGVTLISVCAYGAYGIFRTAKIGQSARSKNLILSEIKLLPFALFLLFVSLQHQYHQTMRFLPLALLPGALLSLLQLCGVVKFEQNTEESK